MLYPERPPAPESLPDRLLGAAGFALHRLLGRRLRGGAALAAQVRARAAALRREPLAPLLAPLRLRLRREGMRRDLLLEAFAAYCAALPEDEPPPGAEVLAAARWLARGGVAELADAGERVRALGLAAFARVLHGTPVHLLAAGERAAQALGAALRPAFGRLGIELGCVSAGMDETARRAAYATPLTCAAQREIGLDYLRDHALFGGAPGSLRTRLERMSGGPAARHTPILQGLRSALVLEADLAMLDDARAPLVIAREADQSQERLMYEQAMELARALQAGRDFSLDEGELRLTESAAALLDRLVTPLGGLWAARERREELVGLALHALHVLQRDVDYRVERDAVVLPERPREEAEAAAAEDAVLQMLLEVKEGCRTSQRREVVARLTIPGFLARYLHLGGVCADARGLEGELWRFYGLRTARAGRRAAGPSPRAAVFASSAGRHAALVERARAAAPQALLIAVRTPNEAQAIERALAAAGIAAATARGRSEELDRPALAALDRPGGVALALFPAQGRPRPPGAPPLRLAVAELHDSARHVAALAAASGAWQVEVLLALEDEAVRAALQGWLAELAASSARARGAVAPWLAAFVARAAQRGAERAQALLRQELAAREQYLRDLLAFSGEGH
jgi:preprotein translocase subunit SecA